MSELKPKKNLSDKPSEIISEALKELEAAEKNPKVDINMAYYLVEKDHLEPKCLMCLAGSVMFNRTPAIRRMPYFRHIRSTSVCQYSEKTSRKLQFLSDLQFGGDTTSAFAYLGMEPPKGLEWVAIPWYEDDKAGYKKALRSLATKLNRRGM